MIRIRILAALAVPLALVGWLGFDFASLEADEAIERRLCPLVESSARANGLPVPYLTRLLFRESRFRLDAVSWSGAQGVAQFMPRTAAALGLLDPFDPEQAIPTAARHLSALRRRFGNMGLAAAAYNAGETRLAAWLAGKGELKAESRSYVAFVTGRGLEEWRSGGDTAASEAPVLANVSSPAQSPPAAVALGREDRTDGPDAVIRSLEAPTGVEAGPEPTCLQVAAVLRAPAPVTSLATLFKGSRSGPAIMRAAAAGPRPTARSRLSGTTAASVRTRIAERPARPPSSRVAVARTRPRGAIRIADGRPDAALRAGRHRQREAARRAYAALRLKARALPAVRLGSYRAYWAVDRH